VSGLSRQARRHRALAGLALGAALLHAALLGTLEVVLPGRDGRAAAVMAVALLPPPAPVPVPVPVPMPVAERPAPAPPRVEATPARPSAKSVVTPDAAEPAHRSGSAPEVAPETIEAPAAAASAPAVAAADANPEPQAAPPAPRAAGSAPEAEAAAAAPAEVPTLLAAAGRDAGSAPADPTPVYRTRFPPAMTLHYDLARGALGGRGELVWQPGPEGYMLRLTGSVAGLDVLTQTSQGGFDAAGLAPRRFTDQRLRRAAQAANFQREVGRIGFSGPSTEVALLPGTQDRLSWMIQLAAVLAADPRLAGPGGRVLLPVVGARGDFGVWAFAWVDAPGLATRSGEVATAHFVREPRGPQDTRVEVWLDPARDHLPVRATLRNAGDGDALELQLRSIERP